MTDLFRNFFLVSQTFITLYFYNRAPLLTFLTRSLVIICGPEHCRGGGLRRRLSLAQPVLSDVIDTLSFAVMPTDGATDIIHYGSLTPRPYPTRSLPARLWPRWNGVCSGPQIQPEKFWLNRDLNPGLPNEKPALYPLLHELMLKVAVFAKQNWFSRTYWPLCHIEQS